MTATKYRRGEHPNTLNNLTSHSGRPQAYDEAKKKRYLTVTDKGWQGMQELAKNLGCSGISELLERAGRGEIPVGEQNG